MLPKNSQKLIAQTAPSYSERPFNMRSRDSVQTTILENLPNLASQRLTFGFHDDLDAYRDSIRDTNPATMEYYDNQDECWVLLVNFGRFA